MESKKTQEYYLVPDFCPSCGSILIWEGADLMCVSGTCPEKNLYQVEHFITTLGVENITAVTLKKLGCYSIFDLYDLDALEIAELDGFGIKRAEQVVYEIQKSLKTTPDKLLASFGLVGISVENARNILKMYKFDELFKLNKEDFIKVPGIGEVLSKNLLKVKEYKELYDFLIDQGLEWKVKDNKLQGKVIVCTGNGPVKRDFLQVMVEDKGGVFGKTITKKTDYLVASEEPGVTKMKKATDYGIKVITYSQLLEMLN